MIKWPEIAPPNHRRQHHYRSRWPDLHRHHSWIDQRRQGGRLLLESKADMKKRGMPSPDEADAVSLCFSEPGGSPIVRSKATGFNRKIEYQDAGYA
jgi:hypothetical protein